MTTYERSFKEEAVKLSDEIGIKKAAAQLGIPYYTLADWRHRQNIHGDQAHVGSGHKRESGDERERRTGPCQRDPSGGARFFRKEPKEVKAHLRYGFIETAGKRRSVKELCRVLEVSESGYYRYLKNKDKPRKDALLSAKMKEILDEHPCNDNYGAPRMKQALEQRGVTAGLRRVTRLMRLNGWLHTPRRRPKGLTKVDPEAMQAENLIKQDFSAEEPCRKLLTDITQVQCADGKLYVSPILDCFNGEVLDLCMRDNMKKELCIDTVQALRRYPVKDAILHSDRGSQYTSAAFRETLDAMNIRQSLSGVDHCYDNARMESFFATLKKELLYRIPTYRMTMEEVKTRIFRYVFIYYNQLRVYSSNPGGWPPAVFRRMQLELSA